MNPNPIAIALMLAIGASTSTLAMADTPPTAPGNLTAKLYAGAGGEIFWNCSTDDRGIRGYEVTRNGQSIGLRDALSFYDVSLRADTAYTSTVTAVDTAGQRSATSSVMLGSTTTAPAIPSGTDTPASPAGLRASVYSATTAELFWTRATKPGLRYEVRRDGNIVTTTDGISHYASGLAAGRSYAYQVITIDGSGKRSAPASIEVNMRSGSASGTPATPVTPPTTGGSTLAAIQPKDVSIKIYSATSA